MMIAYSIPVYTLTIFWQMLVLFLLDKKKYCFSSSLG